MSKRKIDEDEDVAEAEVQAAIAAAKDAPADEEINGLGSGTAMVLFDVKAKPAKQYKSGYERGDKPLVLVYLTIRGLAEVPRLMLAEAGVEYIHLASPMSETQAVACEWRKRSPNGLTPMVSGLGVPRAHPISQSASVVRYLAQRFGMTGATELDGVRADVLYETAKDLAAKADEITGKKDATQGAKGPTDTAARIAVMLDTMPNPADEGAALNFGQIGEGRARAICES